MEPNGKVEESSEKVVRLRVVIVRFEEGAPEEDKRQHNDEAEYHTNHVKFPSIDLGFSLRCVEIWITVVLSNVLDIILVRGRNLVNVQDGHANDGQLEPVSEKRSQSRIKAGRVLPVIMVLHFDDDLVVVHKGQVSRMEVSGLKPFEFLLCYSGLNLLVTLVRIYNPGSSDLRERSRLDGARLLMNGRS